MSKPTRISKALKNVVHFQGRVAVSVLIQQRTSSSHGVYLLHYWLSSGIFLLTCVLFSFSFSAFVW